MNDDGDGQYFLNWNDHMNHFRRTFAKMLTKNELVDVTLCCEGGRLSAHKMLLSACSQFFLDAFKENPCSHPIVILKGVKYTVLRNLLKFLYNGEVHMKPDSFESFLETAKLLQIHGLTECNNAENVKKNLVNTSGKEHSVQDVNTNDNQFVNVHIKEEEETNSEDFQTRELTNTAAASKSEPVKDLDLNKNMKEVIKDGQLKTSLHHHRCYSSTAPLLKRPVALKCKGMKTNDVQLKRTFRSQGQLKCYVCSKEYFHENSLRQHMKQHTEGTKCPICVKVLCRKYQLRVHLKKQHGIDIASKRQLAGRLSEGDL